MRFGLSEDLAHAIVKRTMEVIPYNVNVMNNEGIIIASGDKSREGFLHKGALTAIQKKGIFEVTVETLTEKMGVNLPIYYGNEIIGVIGISGDPKEVRPLVYVIKVVAELIIEQQYALNKDLEDKLKLENFLREWCSVSREKLSERFVRRAEQRGINIDIPRVAVLMSGKRLGTTVMDSLKGYLHDDEYVIRYQDNMLVLLKDISSIAKRIELITQKFAQIEFAGVGDAGVNLAESVKKAGKALSAVKNMQKSPSNIMYFFDCLIYDMVTGYKEKKSFQNVIAELSKQADYLVDTVAAYLRKNGNVNDVASELHIHRNTLAYRIQKIEEYTGKNLHDVNDLFFFYIACLACGIEID